MQKVTCKFCLQLEARMTIAGERSSQYACHHCGEVFEVDHPVKAFETQAKPQSFALPAVGDLAAIEPERVSHAS